MRNLGLIISFWLSVVLIPTNSLALGLGEVQVNSFLNQPLKAEIEVISARVGEIDNLLVGLASRDAFTRAGLSRPNLLTDLRFTVQKNEEGDSAVILVTTKAAIKEPFLNFLVEADWSKGRLLREFTILLDPPFYADSPSPTQQPEAVQPVAETIQAQPEPDVTSPIVETEPTESMSSTTEQQTITEPIAFSDEDQNVDNVAVSGSGVVESTGDVVVNKGNTLWSIASAQLDSGYSMSQIMLAIQRANPDAFGDNNINNLKVGSVLRMPDFSEMGEIDQQQAYAQVLEQNGLWDDYVARVTGKPVIAGESESSGDSYGADTEGDTGELNLVTPGDGESDAAGLQNEGDDANELRVKLALAEEELDASKVVNQELESRIGELEARLSKFEELQKMVEIEDDSLAQIQENQAQEDETVVSSEAISEEQKAADEEALLEELLTDETEAASAEDADDAMVEDTSSESVITVVEESDAVGDDSLDSEQSGEALPVPVIVTEPVMTEPSMLDGILPESVVDMLPDVSGLMDGLALDPLILGGIGGILLLLIGLVIYKRKKSADDEDVVVNDPIFAMGDEEDDEELTPIHLAEGAFEGLEDEDSEIGAITQETELPSSMVEEEEDDFSRTAVISSEEMPEPEAPAEPVSDEQDDILNEADVYLAYNLYDNAEELLTSSLEANPERADYRSKLLDTHFATKNVDAFVREAETLKSMGNPADRYWDRVLVMGFELAPDNDLFAGAKDSDVSAADLEIAKPVAADFDLGAEEDDTNFSTTDFDLGESDTNTFEATDFSSAEIGEGLETDQFEGLPDLDEEESPDLAEEELPDLPAMDELPAMDDEEDVSDDMVDLDFSFDDDESEQSSEDDTDISIVDELEVGTEDSDEDLDFGLPDDLDLGGDEDLDLESTAVLEAGTAVIDIEEFTVDEEDDDNVEIEPTSVISIDDPAAVDESIDFGMEDTAMMQVAIEDDDGEDDVILDLGDIDDDDALSMDVDIGAGLSETDTFAPGDFVEPEELDAMEADIGNVDFDDIEDLMLPDDVDEVSTKLDLARAFIDMGDAEGARSSLDEVMQEGNDEQKAEAKELIDQL